MVRMHAMLLDSAPAQTLRRAYAWVGHGLRTPARWIHTWYPFTLVGSLLFAAAVYLFARSVTVRDPVGLFLSTSVLALLVLLAVLARLQALRASRGRIEWHSTSPIHSRFNRQHHRMEVEGGSSWWFFRLHCVLRGRLECSPRNSFSFYKDASATSGAELSVPLFLPFSGTLRCRRALLVRDLFGLVRAGFGEPAGRTLAVRPPILTQQDLPSVYAAGGERETSRTKSPEEERYYMREYVPGDRFRDINWKASTRISNLYTRISPLTQDQTQVITVYLRHFRRVLGAPGRGYRESLESLVHLDLLKGWVLSFMRQVKRQNESYEFRLVTANGDTLLENETDIDEIAGEVGALHYVDEPPELFHDPKDRLIVVFSTVYDEALGSFLEARPQVQAHIFRTEAPGRATELPVDLGYAMVPAALPTRLVRLRDRRYPPSAVRESERVTVVDQLSPIIEFFGPASRNPIPRSAS